MNVRTLDSICEQEKVDTIHFLKIDVEGHELQTIEGASNLISSGSIDFIQFEFGGPINPQFRIFFQRLLGHLERKILFL